MFRCVISRVLNFVVKLLLYHHVIQQTTFKQTERKNLGSYNYPWKMYIREYHTINICEDLDRSHSQLLMVYSLDQDEE